MRVVPRDKMKVALAQERRERDELARLEIGCEVEKRLVRRTIMGLPGFNSAHRFG